MNAETIAGKLRHFAAEVIQFFDTHPSRKIAYKISAHATLLAEEIVRDAPNEETDRLIEQLVNTRNDLDAANERIVSLIVETTRLEDQNKAAYYKGRGLGKKIEREKREKMLDGLSESRRIWQDRAKTAEAQVAEYKKAAMTHGIMDFDAYIKEYQGALDNVAKLSNPDAYQLKAMANRLGFIAIERWKMAEDLRDYDEMKRKLDAAERTISSLFEPDKPPECTGHIGRIGEEMADHSNGCPNTEYADPNFAPQGYRLYPIHTPAALDSSWNAFLRNLKIGWHSFSERTEIRARFDAKRKEYAALDKNELIKQNPVKRSYSESLPIDGKWHFIEVHHSEADKAITWYVDGRRESNRPV